MKPKDVLLDRWAEVLARKGDLPAIFDTRGKVVRTFHEVDKHAQVVEADMRPAKPHTLYRLQIGNHADWPSLFLACLRAKRIVLPIDESVSPEQANSATAVAAKSETTEWGDESPTLFKLTSGTTALPRMIRFRSEQLLADCDQICDTMGITE
ncbi:MAG TPA: hypothetical protein VJ721_09435, partial [Chthoniobacterales bacterium]|nr:hypothetical protein [Chthoniobacterales bacterium]